MPKWMSRLFTFVGLLSLLTNVVLIQIIRKQPATYLPFWSAAATEKQPEQEIVTGDLNIENFVKSSRLVNGGFEEGTLTPWEVSQGSSLATGHPYSGNSSVKISGDDQGIWQLLSDLTPNTHYSLTVYLKGGGVDEKGSLFVKEYGGAEIDTDALAATVDHNNYTQFAVSFTTGMTNTTAVVGIWRWMMGSGDLYVDDFELWTTATTETAHDPNESTGTTLVASEAQNVEAVVSNNPSVVGLWSPVYQWPVIAIHAALLPSGKVLAWDSVSDDLASFKALDQPSTRVTMWDPATNVHTRVDETAGSNIFCAGTEFLPDGRLLAAGGNIADKDGGGLGIQAVHLFDSHTLTWTRTADMTSRRWYPSLATLGNGEILTIGGPDDRERAKTGVPEVFTHEHTWRTLDEVTDAIYQDALYPWVQTAPNGKVLFAGPDDAMSYIDPVGAGSSQKLGERDGTYRGYGSYATYDIGKMLVAGGLSGENVFNTAHIVDFTDDIPQVMPTGSMAMARHQLNLTILADGQVLATGGNNVSEKIDLQAGIYPAEIWNPATGQWQILAAMRISRQYHSTALLLPDGRVLSGGSGYRPGGTMAMNQSNAEIFSPPYLFTPDGSLALQPVILAGPDKITYGQKFTATLGQADEIEKVHLIKLGAVTHSVNMGQRLVPLAFTQNGSALAATAPANANLAPPGYYMLFVVDHHGTPSVAKILQVVSEF